MTAPPIESPVTADTSDVELLAEYARTRSDAAFRAIVARYVNLVHAAALRHTHDAHVAEDVTQAVFLIFSQRADALRAGTVLAGWFLLTTRNVSRNALRQESRLKRREQKAAEMQPELDPALPPDAKLIVPLLDDALAKLGDVDRNVILQRFYLSKSHREVGRALGLSEEAATKRANRALFKLRQLLERAGVTTAEGALASALPLIAAKAPAPASLVSAIHASLSTGSSPGVAALAKAAAAPATISWAGVAIGSVAAALVIGVGVYAAVAFLRPSAPAPAPVTGNTAVAAARTITLVAKDKETDQPIEGADVQVKDNLSGNGLSAWGKTDASGKFVIEVPPQFQYMSAIISAAGRAPLGIRWSNYTLRGGVPPVYDIPMERGTSIGGVVRDGDGKPIPGIQISLYNRNSNETDAPQFSSGNEKIIPDAEGHWRYDNAPSDISSLGVSLSSQAGRRGEVANQATPEQLRKLAAVMTITVGKGVSGVVLDASGKPLSGATVFAGFSLGSSKENQQTMKTDEQGHFEFASINKYDCLVVTARGFAPEMIDRDRVSALKDPVEIRLSPGKTLVAVVTWPDGKPVTGAKVSASQWRNQQVVKWSTKTDSTGQFTWTEAPADEVEFTISTKNPNSSRAVRLTAAGAQQPLKVAYFGPANISGTVVDADTKEPIKQFTMIYGVQWTGQNSVTFQTHAARTIADGKYEATITQVDDGAQLKVEADGYLAAVSRMIKPGESNVTINFELKKGTGPNGTLADVDGKPVVGATVFLVPNGTSFYHNDENQSYNDSIARSVTDKSGHFTFRPQEKESYIIAMADTGMVRAASKELTSSATLKLQPYGRIEGFYRIGTKPAANVKLMAHPTSGGADNEGRIEIQRSGQADPDGHFVIERLPPGKVQLHQVIPLSDRMTTYKLIGAYEVEAGKTTTVSAGGVGRPVVAKLVLPSKLPSGFNLQEGLNVNVQPKARSVLNWFANLPFPDNFADMTEQEQQRWNTEFFQSPAGQALQKKMVEESQAVRVPASFQVAPDAMIRADDVPPGDYQLDATLREPYTRNKPTQNLMGTAKLTFTVPDEPKCPTEEVLDLGTIELRQAYQGEVGSPFPSLQLVTTEGKPFKLEELRGKVVLLHVWGMHQRELMPAIKSVYEAHKDDSHLAIVNIPGDHMIPAWEKRIVEKEGLPGLRAMNPGAFGGSGNTLFSQLPPTFPAIYLISADGKLVARDVKADQLPQAVNDALTK